MAALCLWGIAKHLIHFLLQSLGHTNSRCKNKYSHLGEGNRNNQDQKASGDPQCTLRGSGYAISWRSGSMFYVIFQIICQISHFS